MATVRFLNASILLSFALVVAPGCGGSDDDGALDVDGGDTEDEGLFTYLTEIGIPAIEDDVATCCRDFGEISRPNIEEDEDQVDNAYAELVDALEEQGFQFQSVIDEQIEEGVLTLLGEHVDLDGDSGSFTLNALRGAFAEDTDGDSAAQGDGVFTIDDLSFGDDGEPRLSFAADLDNGELEASADTVTLLLPVGDAALPFVTHDVEVQASGTIEDGSASYEDGTFSGYFLVDETFEMFNEFLASDQCECLGLEDDDVFAQEDGEWAPNACQSEHACEDEGEGLCAVLAGDDIPDEICPFLPGELQDLADLNTGEADPAEYTGISVGFEWESVPAQVAE